MADVEQPPKRNSVGLGTCITVGIGTFLLGGLATYNLKPPEPAPGSFSGPILDPKKEKKNFRDTDFGRITVNGWTVEIDKEGMKKWVGEHPNTTLAVSVRSAWYSATPRIFFLTNKDTQLISLGRKSTEFLRGKGIPESWLPDKTPDIDTEYSNVGADFKNNKPIEVPIPPYILFDNNDCRVEFAVLQFPDSSIEDAMEALKAMQQGRSLSNMEFRNLFGESTLVQTYTVPIVLTTFEYEQEIAGNARSRWNASYTQYIASEDPLNPEELYKLKRLAANQSLGTRTPFVYVCNESDIRSPDSDISLVVPKSIVDVSSSEHMQALGDAVSQLHQVRLLHPSSRKRMMLDILSLQPTINRKKATQLKKDLEKEIINFKLWPVFFEAYSQVFKQHQFANPYFYIALFSAISSDHPKSDFAKRYNTLCITHNFSEQEKDALGRMGNVWNKYLIENKQ